jgi:lipoprotein-anchoring transpeptidase ErfK/SrfK
VSRTVRTPTAPAHQTIVAIATVPSVAVYKRPRAARPAQRLANPQPEGTRLVFVVRRSTAGWLNVLLPVRPNGSSGWIRRRDVTLRRHDYRIVVALHAHFITVYRGTTVFDREPIGVGKAQTPTPGGVYYTKALLQPPNPNGLYGPYAYELSGFSDVLWNFNGGNGVIGIHGTNQPWLLGHDVSHGCIRMSNAGITRLAHTLPLGVPVEIRA